MVLPKASYITRTVFQKTFSHGGLPSLVAASQSSYASQHHHIGSLGSRLGKSQNHQLHNAFSDRSQQPGSANKQDSGLAAYYAAWQKHQQIEHNQWQQFQFAKRIEWKPQTLLAETKTRSKEDVKEDIRENAAAEQELAPVAKLVDRSYSTSAVDDIKKSVDGERAEAEALAKIDEAIAQEVAKFRKEAESTAAVEEAIEDEDEELVSRQPTPESSLALSEFTPESSFILESAPLTPVSDTTDSHTQELIKLAGKRQYAEIPAVFESLLQSGITPTATAYNALLSAAINLPKSRHEVVPKALNVYSDMLNRNVQPDRKTYSILVELLSARALEAMSMKNALEEKRARYGGMEEKGKFMLKSEDFESKMLAEDDSLSLAIRMFDSAIASHPKGFAERTYRLLVSACAEEGKIQDMVRIYQQMESRRVIPRPEMFVNMIHAFSSSGDLRSAVECYDEYKALAIAHDNGELAMIRKDADVYASVVKAYMISSQPEGAERFFNKLEAASPQEEDLSNLRDTVGLRAFLAEWLKQGSFEKALSHASEKLSPRVRDIGLTAVAIRAADRDNVEVASQAFAKLSDGADVSRPAMALGAMYVRNGNLEAAEKFWKILELSGTNTEFIQATAMHSVALIGSGRGDVGLRRARLMFARIREGQQGKSGVVEQIDEAIEVIGQFMMKRGLFLPATQAIELMWTMIDNHGLVPAVAGHLLAGFGPEDIAQLGWDDLQLLVQVQASMIMNGSRLDVGHEARFSHLLQLVSAGRVDAQTEGAIEEALAKLDRPELSAQWQSYKFPTQYPGYAPIASPAPAFEESFDPYAATTDNKGSVAITDLLEKTHGKFSSHLNEALVRFKNMRRAGRHPRFFTYAKFISAAAKENRLQLAHDILALAKQDVPYLPQYRIVRYGWVTILDAMVAACLTTGRRDLAGQFHQEMLAMGAAPSANTFGLYITTLKESTKTFDEASEAVKIFLQAKSEGVEPSSFLYNALIGKLGKARRIDDCLFYFQEMRTLGIRPTSVTYGTIVNALCRVSDEKFAEELFEEMESMPNYKPRPAPYHSMMQFFLSTKRDRSKVLSYYERMRARNIQPTTHTYKLLIDTYATLDPIDMEAAEGVLQQIRQHGELPEAVHFAALIHAKGCVLRDMEGARKIFDSVLADRQIRLQACLFQALFESMVANNNVDGTEEDLATMKARGVEMTPYIANALIHGWANAKDIEKAKDVYNSVPKSKREPSTYEAMTRAYIALEDREAAMTVVNEALSRGYPTAVANKILDLVGGGKAQDAE
jgi:pentatricopeptide repeat protein